MKLYWRPARSPPCPANPTPNGPRLPMRPRSAPVSGRALAGRLVPAPNYIQSSGGVADDQNGPHLRAPSIPPFAPTGAPNLHHHAPFARIAPLPAPIGPIRRQATICPPAPFSAFLRKKNPKNNHRHRGHQAAQSTCSTTTWRFCDPATRESHLKTESHSLTSADRIRHRTNAQIMRKKARIREIRSIRGSRDNNADSLLPSTMGLPAVAASEPARSSHPC
jgi:hypothetical protein